MFVPELSRIWTPNLLLSDSVLFITSKLIVYVPAGCSAW